MREKIEEREKKNKRERKKEEKVFLMKPKP